MTSIDLVLPCLDEEQGLAWLLPLVPSGVHAIVVDNGSTDSSAQVAAELGATVIQESRKGFGAACWAGLQACRGDIVAFMDADASLDPRQLPRVFEPLVAGTADLVLGARRRMPGAWPVHARLANRALASDVRRRTGLALTDLGPMRAAKREQLLGLGLTDRRSGWPLEMVLKASSQGWRVRQVSVDYLPRAGKSKVTGTVLGSARAVRDMRRVLSEYSR